MNPIILTARYDKAFKAVFGNEENLDLTKRLLELILHKKVKNIIIRNPELIKKYVYDCGKKVDLVLDVDDSVIQMEMYCVFKEHLHLKNFYFFSVNINTNARQDGNDEIQKFYLLIDFTDERDSEIPTEEYQSHQEYFNNVFISEFFMDETRKRWFAANQEDARKLFRYLSIFDMNETELKALPISEDEFMNKLRDKVIECKICN